MKKTVLFFGAGATKSLGFPITFEQDKLFKESLLYKPNDKYPALSEYVQEFFGKNAESFTVMQLYNLLDEHIRSESKYRNFYYTDAIKAREEMLEYLQEIFTEKTQSALNSPFLDEYIDFFKELAKINLQDKQKILSTSDLQTEEFIFSKFSYISLNWDVMFIWCMFQAHKELNEQNHNWFSVKGKNVKLKTFNDFGIYLATKSLKENSNGKKWFPYNETVAMRINDTDHLSDRIVTLIKTYFSHGQTNWLECPKCGNVSMYLGDTWDKRSSTLPMSPKTYKCVHCREDIDIKNSAMLLQTLIKKKPSYIMEIQKKMRLEIENAERIIFVGYSLPDDDFEYRTMFLSKNKDKEIYVVTYQEDGLNEWLLYDEINQTKEVKNFYNLFGEDTQFNCAGFPNAKNSIIEVLKS